MVSPLTGSAAATYCRDCPSRSTSVFSDANSRTNGVSGALNASAVGQPIQKDVWRLIWICPFEPPGSVWIM